MVSFCWPCTNLFLAAKTRTASLPINNFGIFHRKLHCMRNYIHMNLMISFILRYTTVLIKDRVVQAHYDPARFDSLNQEEMKLFCDEFGGVNGYMVSGSSELGKDPG